MPDAYENYEARFLNVATSTSGADAKLVASAPVPAGKVWTILAAYVTSSADETQDYWFAILERSASYAFPITRPQEVIIDSSLWRHFPLVTEGMELKLFPGEKLYGCRDAATAGSTMTLALRYIESDLPLYEQVEIQQRRTEIKRGEMRDRITTGRSGAFGTGREGGIPARPGRTKEPA